MKVMKDFSPGKPAGWLVLAVLAISMLSGCTWMVGDDTDGGTKTAEADKPIQRYTGEMSQAVSLAYTTSRNLALTFNGMADAQTMDELLDQLDALGIKATFFLPGMRVAEEPDIARQILSRGHEIENNTLNAVDMSRMDYEQIYKEIHLADDVIRKQTGVTPKFVRTQTGAISEDIRLAAAQSGQQAVISYSLFLHNWKAETPQQKKNYIRKYINRGGIVAIDLAENRTLNESVDLIAAEASAAGYHFVTLDKLVATGGVRKPADTVQGYQAAKYNADYAKADYKLVYSHKTAKKEIALTFDDWGTDETITKLLDILDQYHVKGTFFLRADGVEKNPNLARAIAQAGHDVGNHTYSHPVLTKISVKQLQDEVVKAHRIITDAIQQQPAMLFRPPTGDIDDRTARIIAAAGYRNIVDFDIDPNDWNRERTASQIVNSVIQQSHSGGIILLHSLDDTHTAEALPGIIQNLRKQGYTFVKLSDWISDNGNSSGNER
ncbi:polysaccharide deacetylase family protein [Paenibacillus sp. VMFN-D1]|uniref:polysaccharide deacetylase family protein n=1 Tax=Paenibacillus sp. VMFN-D1 TaxID=2135608 RepID=UPI000E275F0F|nr:polysaccharide deacetylase family protein [Paenibacillus sp. VMFN-D1]RED40887.1 peptidoglycan/xylan/chitin deacetylase (PgdA/CDA1 family) [Paenibacillus sp. VMFN-D1]